MAMDPSTQTALAMLLLLSVLQLLLLRKHVEVYLRHRHFITVSNRVLRAAAAFLPVLNRGSDVMSRWGTVEQHSVAAALAVYTTFPPLMHLQVNTACRARCRRRQVPAVCC
jgi:hypothetical protein